MTTVRRRRASLRANIRMMRSTARYLWLSLRETASLPRLTTLAAVVLTVCLVPFLPQVNYDTGTGSPTTGTVQRDRNDNRAPSSTPTESTPEQPQRTTPTPSETTGESNQQDGTQAPLPPTLVPDAEQPGVQDQQRAPQQTAPSTTGTSQPPPSSDQRKSLLPPWLPFPGRQDGDGN